MKITDRLLETMCHLLQSGSKPKAVIAWLEETARIKNRNKRWSEACRLCLLGSNRFGAE